MSLKDAIMALVCGAAAAARFLWRHLWLSAAIAWGIALGIVFFVPSLYLCAVPVAGLAILLSGVAVVSPVSKR